MSNKEFILAVLRWIGYLCVELALMLGVTIIAVTVVTEGVLFAASKAGINVHQSVIPYSLDLKGHPELRKLKTAHVYCLLMVFGIWWTMRRAILGIFFGERFTPFALFCLSLGTVIWLCESYTFYAGISGMDWGGSKEVKLAHIVMTVIQSGIVLFTASFSAYFHRKSEKETSHETGFVAVPAGNRLQQADAA